MIAYAQIALALLKIAQFFITRAHDTGLIKEGEDRAIARETASILAKSKYAKDIMSDVAKLDEKQTDDLLKQLEA